MADIYAYTPTYSVSGLDWRRSESSMWEQVHNVSKRGSYENWYTRGFNDYFNRWLEDTGITRENIQWIENEYGQTTEAHTVKTIAYYLHNFGLWDVATALKVGSVVALELIGNKAGKYLFEGAKWGMTGLYTLYKLGLVHTGIVQVFTKVLEPVWRAVLPIYAKFGFAKFMAAFSRGLRKTVKNIRNTRTYNAAGIRGQLDEAYPKWQRPNVTQTIRQFKKTKNRPYQTLDDFRTTKPQPPKGIISKIGEKAAKPIDDFIADQKLPQPVITVIDTILEAVEEASKAFKYQGRMSVPHFANVVDTKVDGLPENAKDRLDKEIRKQFRELFSDEDIKEDDMPYIRKWVPFRRRRYGYSRYGGRGRRYGGYRPRRRYGYRRY